MSRNAVAALLDEWDRSRGEIVMLLPRIRDEEMLQGDALDESCTRGILVHVLRAGYGYAKWICDVLGFPKLERGADPKTLAGRDAFQRGFEDLGTHFRRALEPLEDVHLDGRDGAPPPQFPTGPGELYSVEQLLEHAVCHNLRHRRQLEHRAIFRD